MDLETLNGLASKWRVRLGRLHTHAGQGLVAFGTLGDQQVVLKVGSPDAEFRNQVRCLNLLPPAVCARLIQADEDSGALLLERVLPGTSLWETWDPASDDHQTRILARASSRIALEARSGFPTVGDWMAALDRYEDRYQTTGPIPFQHLKKARSLFKSLHGADAPRACLLHGDLHHGNLLKSGHGWKCIDPKGVVADPAFEVYAMIRNPYDRLDPTPGNLQRRLLITAEVTGLETGRLRAWSYVGCILSASWSLEDGDNGWPHALACADALQE